MESYIHHLQIKPEHSHAYGHMPFRLIRRLLSVSDMTSLYEKAATTTALDMRLDPSRPMSRVLESLFLLSHNEQWTNGLMVPISMGDIVSVSNEPAPGDPFFGRLFYCDRFNFIPLESRVVCFYRLKDPFKHIISRPPQHTRLTTAHIGLLYEPVCSFTTVDMTGDWSNPHIDNLELLHLLQHPERCPERIQQLIEKWLTDDVIVEIEGLRRYLQLEGGWFPLPLDGRLRPPQRIGEGVGIIIPDWIPEENRISHLHYYDVCIGEDFSFVTAASSERKDVVYEHRTLLTQFPINLGDNGYLDLDSDLIRGMTR